MARRLSRITHADLLTEIDVATEELADAQLYLPDDEQQGWAQDLAKEMSEASHVYGMAIFLMQRARDRNRDRALSVERKMRRKPRVLGPAPGAVIRHYTEEERLAQVYPKVRQLIEQVQADMTVVFTRELMGTVFKLQNGQVLRWGSATVSEHQQRLSMLVKHIGGTVETAGIHAAALAQMKAAKVNSLDELLELQGTPDEEESA